MATRPSISASRSAPREINGDGSGALKLFEITGGGSKMTKLAGFEFAPRASGGLAWQYDDGSEEWISGGNVHIGATVGADIPPVPVYFPLGPCPICVPAYWRGHIDVGFDAGLELLAWDAPGDPAWSGTLDLDPFPYAEAMLGVGAADVPAIEGHLGGGARISLQYPDEPTLQNLKVFLTGAARLAVLIFEYDSPLLTCTYDFVSGEGGCDWEMVVGAARIVERCCG